MELDRYPHNKESLLREVDVRMRIADIRQVHAVKDRLAPKWWEPVMVILLFASALGLLASLFQFSEMRDSPLNKYLFFWIGMMVLSMVFCFQVILFKIYTFRRANDLLMRIVEEMRKDIDRLEAGTSGTVKPGNAEQRQRD